MPTYLVCPICEKQFECTGPHEGPHDVLTVVKKCPVTKGAIYVNVKNTAQTGVQKVKTFCKDSPDSTDPAGFAFYERLDVGAYSTRIDLDASDKTVKDRCYATARTSVNAKVQAGKITIVEFVLNRYADLLVRLERKDGESDLPRATFSAKSSGHTPDRPETKEHEAKFRKMKPTEVYTVQCDLHKDDAKNFRIDRVKDTNVTVNPDKLSEVVFQVQPRYWIELALKDEKDSGMKGEISLKHSASDSYDADDVGTEMKHVLDLKPGTIDVEGVTLAVSREFESLS